MNRVVLTTSTVGNEYYDMLLVFLHTMRVVGKYDGPMRVDLINGTSKEVREIRAVYPGAEVQQIDLTNMTMIETMYTRPRQIMRALDDGFGQVLAIDADTMVRDNIEEMWTGLVENTVKVWDKVSVLPIFPDKHSRDVWKRHMDRHMKKLNVRIQGGVQLYGNGSVTRNFYREFMSRLGEQFKFYDGQVTLYHMINERFGGIRYINLGPKFNDSFFNKGTIIWHAKHKHFDAEPWATEQRKWLKRARDLLSA